MASGIPADRREHLFDRFYRAHTGTPYDYGGTGLGLYVAHAIVERHGGTLSCDSVEGQGTTFTCGCRSTNPPMTPPPPRAASVLVVDDEEDIIELLRFVLEGEGLRGRHRWRRQARRSTRWPRRCPISSCST